MNNNMKKVTVEVEIPVDMEVSHWMQVKEHITISLVQRKPRELKFRELVGRDYINTGEYYTDSFCPEPILWARETIYFREDPKCGGTTTIWELVNEC